jgi:hypothetical protein
MSRVKKSVLEAVGAEAIAADKQAPAAPDPQAMQTLVKSAAELAIIEERLDEIKARESELNDRRKQLREQEIPALMKSAGLVNSQNKGSFTIPGYKLHLETRVHASAPAETRPLLFAWLRKRKMKHMITENVHPQTLSAFVRGLREEGKQDPPGVSSYEVTVAKLTKQK